MGTLRWRRSRDRSVSPNPSQSAMISRYPATGSRWTMSARTSPLPAVLRPLTSSRERLMLRLTPSFVGAGVIPYHTCTNVVQEVCYPVQTVEETTITEQACLLRAEAECKEVVVAKIPRVICNAVAPEAAEAGEGVEAWRRSKKLFEGQGAMEAGYQPWTVASNYYQEGFLRLNFEISSNKIDSKI